MMNAIPEPVCDPVTGEPDHFRPTASDLEGARLLAELRRAVEAWGRHHSLRHLRLTASGDRAEIRTLALAGAVTRSYVRRDSEVRVYAGAWLQRAKEYSFDLLEIDVGFNRPATAREAARIPPGQASAPMTLDEALDGLREDLEPQETVSAVLEGMGEEQARAANEQAVR